MVRSVRDILKSDGTVATTPAQVALREMRGLSILLEDLFEAARPDSPDDDWELIYNAIFGSDDDAESIQDRAEAALDRVGRSFPDYCDPDTTYEEDARAWKGGFDRGLELVKGDVESLYAGSPRPERHGW